jgi:hypothetical protein
MNRFLNHCIHGHDRMAAHHALWVRHLHDAGARNLLRFEAFIHREPEHKGKTFCKAGIWSTVRRR